MAVADVGLESRRPALTGAWVGRAVAWGAIGFLVMVVPAMIAPIHSRRWSLAVIYIVVALSLNTLIGHAGQTSLGHQGFLGVGAFTSAYMVTTQEQVFWVGVLVAILTGAVASALMGLVALRVRGLYFALVTLVYGRMAQDSLFNLSLFGSGAGIEAPRPDGFTSERSYYYLCLIALAIVLYLDWRFERSKAGRAVGALRENEQVAASYAIPVSLYKLLAFALSGVFVGMAGALFAHRNTNVVGEDFDFNLALFFVIITVVGGLRSRWGIVVWTALFQLVPEYLAEEVGIESSPFASLVIGAVLLVVILAFYPGGFGQIIQPVTTWLKGGEFKRDETSFVQEGVRGRP